MASENPLWGEERIANELLLKLGIRVSPRTVRKYLPRRPRGRPRGDLRWSTFLRLHARGLIACDFFVAVTASFRLLYELVVIEHGSRRLVHFNVTANPSTAWTLQQLREVVGYPERYKFLLHDRDSIFASHLDESIGKLGIRMLKSPPRCPKAMRSANGRSVRFAASAWTGSFHCQSHICGRFLTSWITHYNEGRPHMALGPGVPDPPVASPHGRNLRSREDVLDGVVIHSKPVLGGLHHEYSFAPMAA